MQQSTYPWDEALTHHLENKHLDYLRQWLPDHVRLCVPDDPCTHWLMSIAEDTCDAGHVHHDIALWLLTDHELHTVMITEEHYDVDMAVVETTFDTSVASHPLQEINGAQLMSVTKPTGAIMEVGLGVMIQNPSLSGHMEPVAFPEMDAQVPMAVNLIPSTITLMGAPERLQEFVSFRDVLLRAVRKNR